MTGPFRGGTGGAGYSGAFTAIGDATSNYFDKLNSYNNQAEQKRQFDASLEENKRQLALQEQKLKMQQYDKFDSGLSTLRTYYENNSKYMSPEDGKAMGDMLQHGEAASMAYWGNSDESGLHAHAQQYGPGKAWGVDEAGNPINMDTIVSRVNKNKPIYDMKYKLTDTYGETAATMISHALLDPTSPIKDNADDFLAMLNSGAFKDSPGKAFAALFAGNTMGPKYLLSSVTKAGFSPESLSIAEDSLKVLPKAAYTTKDDKGNDVIAPEYEALQNFIRENKGAIDNFRQGREIQQGKGQVLAYDTSAFALDTTKWKQSREVINAEKADMTDLTRVANEGDVATMNQPLYKKQYWALQRAADPGISDADIQANYDRDFQDAATIDKNRKSMATARVTLTNNSALQSTMDTDQKTIIYNAIKPFLAGDAVADRNLKDAIRSNSMTQAQFLSVALPTLLRMQNAVDKNSLMETLATAKGGIGRPAIQTMIDGGFVAPEDGKALLDLADQSKQLWDKGVNVQSVTMSAEYQTQAVRKLGASELIKFGVPGKQAEQAANEATAAGVEAYNKYLQAHGITQYAGRLGSSAALAQISHNDQAAITADVQAAVQHSLQAAGYPQLASRAAIQGISTQISEGILAKTRADAANSLADDVVTSGQEAQLSADGLSVLNNNYKSQLINGQLPYAGEIGDATGRTTLADQSVRLATANSTLSLMPLATEAQKQQYTSAIAAGKYDEAIAILKTNNADLDYGMREASTMQALASLDPKAQLASSVKNPSLRAMYQNAVGLANQQRDLTNQLSQMRVGSRGRDGSSGGVKVSDVRSAVISVNGQIDSVLKSNEVKDAQDIIRNLTKTTVGVDPVTGLFKIVQPSNVDPRYAAQVQKAYATLQAANQKVAPLIKNRDALVAQQTAMVTGSGLKSEEAVNVMQSITTPGANLAKLGYTNDAITAPAGQSNCSMFARQTEAKLLGVNPYGAEMQKYFGVDAKNTENKFRNNGSIFVDGVTPTAAMSNLQNLKGGDVVFLDYGDPKLNHVAVYDGNGNVVQHSYTNFHGRVVQGNVNVMGIEEFLQKSGKNVKVSFGRVPGVAGQPSKPITAGTAKAASDPNAPTSSIHPATAPMMPEIKGKPNFRATSVAPGIADPKLGRVIPATSGASQPFSGLGTAEIAKQINTTADFMIHKAKEVNSSNPWDNQSGFLRGYVGFGNSPENANYVSNVMATFQQRPWLQAMQNAKGDRKNELVYINGQTESIAKAKGMNPDLLKALMWNESEWVPSAKRSDGKGGGMGQVEGYFPPSPGTQPTPTPRKPPAPPSATALPPISYTTASSSLPSLRPLGQQREVALQMVVQAAPGIRQIKDPGAARSAIQALTIQVFGTKGQANIPPQKAAAMEQFARELAVYVYGS